MKQGNWVPMFFNILAQPGDGAVGRLVWTPRCLQEAALTASRIQWRSQKTRSKPAESASQSARPFDTENWGWSLYGNTQIAKAIKGIRVMKSSWLIKYTHSVSDLIWSSMYVFIKHDVSSMWQTTQMLFPKAHQASVFIEHPHWDNQQPSIYAETCVCHIKFWTKT